VGQKLAEQFNEKGLGVLLKRRRRTSTPSNRK